MKKFIYSLVFVFLAVFSVQAQDYTPSHNKGIKIKTTVAASTDSLIAIQPNGKIVRSTKTIEDIATNLSDLVDDIGATDPIVANTIFVDTVNGDDSYIELENRNKPLKTLAEAYSRLTNNGVVWDINFIDGNVTRDMGEPMPAFAFNIVSSSAGVFDFSGLEGSEGWTVGNKKYLMPNAKILIGGAAKYFGANASFELVADEVEVGCPNIGSTGIIRGYNSDSYFSNFTVNTLRITNNTLSVPFGMFGDLVINKNYIPSLSVGLMYNGGRLSNVYIKNVQIPTGITNVLFISTTPINNVEIDFISGGGSLLLTRACATPLTVDLDSLKLLDGSEIYLLDRFRSEMKLKGNANNSLINVCYGNYNPGASTDYKLIFDGFTGKVQNLQYTNYSFEFINSNLTFDNFLANKTFGDLVKEVTLRGVNSFFSINEYPQLFVNISSSNPLTIYDYGYATTNVKSFGKNVTVVKPNATFKEKLNEVIIRSKIDLVNKTLDINTTYIIDGRIQLMSNDSIIVPPGGNLTINGYGLESSIITKDVAGQAIFYSRAGGSGGLLMDGLKISSGAGSVFELTDETGFNAVEFVKVNFEDCASLGELNGYRQSLWLNIGLFSIYDGITFSGTWLGGVRNESMIVRNMEGSTGTIFKKGASLVFNSRFFTNANVDLPTGWKFLDFDETNFNSSELLQLQGLIISRSGIFDDTDILYTPNITEESIFSKWSGNTGIKNSSVPFTKLKSPDGSVFKITVDDSGTVISTEL